MATKTKLTVRVETEVLIAAKLYAEAHQTSLEYRLIVGLGKFNTELQRLIVESV